MFVRGARKGVVFESVRETTEMVEVLLAACLLPDGGELFVHARARHQAAWCGFAVAHIHGVYGVLWCGAHHRSHSTPNPTPSVLPSPPAGGAYRSPSSLQLYTNFPPNNSIVALIAEATYNYDDSRQLHSRNGGATLMARGPGTVNKNAVRITTSPVLSSSYWSGFHGRTMFVIIISAILPRSPLDFIREVSLKFITRVFNSPLLGRPTPQRLSQLFPTPPDPPILQRGD
ncbi:hypothetical protein C8F04DRAFT_1236829, partial [Mycena alexandri]